MRKRVASKLNRPLAEVLSMHARSEETTQDAAFQRRLLAKTEGRRTTPLQADQTNGV